MGEQVLNPDARRRFTLPLARTPNNPPPCHFCPKIPQGADPKPENAIEPSERSLLAFQHYRRCRAVGRFPTDVLVEKDAAIIRDVWDAWEQMPMSQLIGYMIRGRSS
jgi:hypothetical protein